MSALIFLLIKKIFKNILRGIQLSSRPLCHSTLHPMMVTTTTAVSRETYIEI